MPCEFALLMHVDLPYRCCRVLLSPKIKPKRSDKSNLLVFYSDDQGWEETGCYGDREIPRRDQAAGHVGPMDCQASGTERDPRSTKPAARESQRKPMASARPKALDFCLAAVATNQARRFTLCSLLSTLRSMLSPLFSFVDFLSILRWAYPYDFKARVSRNRSILEKGIPQCCSRVESLGCSER